MGVLACRRGHLAQPGRVCFKAAPSQTPEAERPTEPGHLNVAQAKEADIDNPVYLFVFTASYSPVCLFVCLFTCLAARSRSKGLGICLVHLQVRVEDLEHLLDVWDVTGLQLRPNRNIWEDDKQTV